jgi:hypothetical protein
MGQVEPTGEHTGARWSRGRHSGRGRDTRRLVGAGGGMRIVSLHFHSTLALVKCLLKRMRVHRASLKWRHLLVAVAKQDDSLFKDREEETQDGGVGDGFFAGEGESLNFGDVEPEVFKG